MNTVILGNEEEEEGPGASRHRLRWGKDGAGVTPLRSGRRQWEEEGPAGGTCRGDEAGGGTFF